MKKSPKNTVKTHTFNGRKYAIDIDQLDGFCEQYKITPEDRRIFILTKPNTRSELITIIHECLHAENWAATESVVDRVSTELGSFLWRLGYRKGK